MVSFITSLTLTPRCSRITKSWGKTTFPLENTTNLVGGNTKQGLCKTLHDLNCMLAPMFLERTIMVEEDNT